MELVEIFSGSVFIQCFTENLLRYQHVDTGILKGKNVHCWRDNAGEITHTSTLLCKKKCVRLYMCTDKCIHAFERKKWKKQVKEYCLCYSCHELEVCWQLCGPAQCLVHGTWRQFASESNFFFGFTRVLDVLREHIHGNALQRVTLGHIAQSIPKI